MSENSSFLFPSITSLERDWDAFVAQEGIADPQAWLDACRIPYPQALQVSLSLGTHCNYNCPFCFNHYEKYYGYYNSVTFSRQEVSSLILRNAPINELAFAVAGEPFLHPDVFGIMDDSREAVGFFTFSTNAGLLTPDKSDRLTEYPIGRIVVSAEGADPETYAQFRKGGCFATFRNHVERVSRNFPGRVEIASVLCRENADSLLRMPELCGALGVSVYDIMPINSHVKTRDRGLTPLRREEAVDFICELVTRCNTHGVRLNLNHMVIDRESALKVHAAVGDAHGPSLESFEDYCPIALGTMLVDPEGRMAFCCYMEAFFKNSLNTPFRELYNTPEALKMRAMSMLGQHPMVCRRYCHKVNANCAPSLETLARRMDEYRLSALPRREIPTLPAGLKVALWPYGSACRRLLAEGFFAGQEVAAVLDRYPAAAAAAGLPAFASAQAGDLDVEAVVITSEAFRLDILREAVRSFGCRPVGIFVVDGSQRVFEYHIPAESAAALGG